MDVTVDASAIAKRILDEPGSAEVRAWVRKGRDRMHAPELLAYELGNMLVRLKADRPEERLSLALTGIRLHRHQPAFELAPELTYYDASYLAVAKRLGAGLLTFDDRMRRAAQRLGIRLRDV